MTNLYRVTACHERAFSEAGSLVLRAESPEEAEREYLRYCVQPEFIKDVRAMPAPKGHRATKRAPYR